MLPRKNKTFYENVNIHLFSLKIVSLLLGINMLGDTKSLCDDLNLDVAWAVDGGISFLCMY